MSTDKPVYVNKISKHIVKAPSTIMVI